MMSLEGLLELPGAQIISRYQQSPGVRLADRVVDTAYLF
jgi:hypothetical protein